MYWIISIPFFFYNIGWNTLCSTNVVVTTYLGSFFFFVSLTTSKYGQYEIKSPLFWIYRTINVQYYKRFVNPCFLFIKFYNILLSFFCSIRIKLTRTNRINNIYQHHILNPILLFVIILFVFSQFMIIFFGSLLI